MAIVILIHGGVRYWLSFPFVIKTKHPAILHTVLQGDWVLDALHGKLFGKHQP